MPIPRTEFAWSRRRAFTLVELLVVIAIIGILVSLLLPAVQAAREAARRTQCTNNIRQMALGVLNHESAHQTFPSGGWGKEYIGDPDRGFGPNQPGSWQFNIFPFIEEQALHDLGQGQAGGAKNQAMLALLNTPVATFYCPSRRSAQIYPHAWLAIFNLTTSSITSVAAVAKNDYAINSGNARYHAGDAFYIPTSYAQIDPTKWNDTDTIGTDYYQNGLSYYRSRVTLAQVTDGTSKTYLLGEKYLMPEAYDFTFRTNGDNQSIYAGFEWDNHRKSIYSPSATANVAMVRDTSGYDDVNRWGSAHAAGVQMALCDGSVRSIPYSIQPLLHDSLAIRNDERPVDMDGL